ncbi:MAG: rhodanese-like domain-containing protein [Flavobacteriales bacterium]|jgi:phage shock protein E|nr:rhodanese-like domain-containing protein [Flavobacteriales bacterium]|tara:strand:+ start:5068 stop:5382 length:315 start_codon:yes stop_codon:yes gene_type:complete
MSILKKIFGIKSTDYNQLMKDGGIVIDVRTPGEFNSGHIKGSINIPLDKIKSKIKKIENLKKPVIFCCASGMRSGQATSITKSRGIDVYNGGGWSSLDRKLNNV